MSSEPEPASVRWKPFAIARNASSTMTTSATATTVESDSHRRCEMLLRLMVVTATTCRNSERMGQPRPSAVAILSRIALSAGMIPVMRPSARISASPISGNAGRHREARV